MLGVLDWPELVMKTAALYSPLASLTTEKSFIRLALLSYYSVCVCTCVCVCVCVQTGGSFKRDRLLSDPSFWNEEIIFQN